MQQLLAVLFLVLSFSARAANPDLPPRLRSVLCIGDSITFGWGTPSVVTPYPERLSNALNTNDSGWSVWNRGVSGEGTAGITTRWNTGTTVNGVLYEGPLSTAAQWHDVVILIGVNDLSSSTPAATIWASIQAIANAALASGARVVLVSVTPWKGHSQWTSTIQANQNTLRGLLQSYVATDTVHRAFVDGYAALGNPSDPDALLPAYDSGDHLHPNDAGAAALAAAVRAVFP